MAAVMWIEVLSRDGEVVARERIDTQEARIGRAFDNDVVVNDPHVAPHHLRVYRGDDGELVAEDLGTVNGLYPEHGAKRLERMPLAGEPGIRIGRTTLRVHDAAHAVAAERPMTPPRAHATWDAGLGVALLLVVLILNWLNLTQEPSANLVLLPIIGLATALALWTGLWAVLSRIFFGQAQFALHLRIAVTACIAIVLWDLLAETVSFSFAWREIAEYAPLGVWAILATTCYAHLTAIGPRHLKLVMGLVLALFVAGATLQYVARWENRELVGQRATLGDLRPPAFRVVPLSSTDQFLKAAEDTRTRVDKARSREPPPGGSLSDVD
ncbi:MAG: FHA domain-containing protein [Pseudomonadota bacterium]|nr:FHA domain-containing protein [Pseudomonadota bacterium]